MKRTLTVGLAVLSLAACKEKRGVRPVDPPPSERTTVIEADIQAADPVPAMKRELARLQERKGQQELVRDRLDRATRRLDKLFRLDAVSAARRAAVEGVVSGVAVAVEGVTPYRLMSIENRWTLQLRSTELPEDRGPRPSTLFAAQMQTSVPRGATIEVVRAWDAGPGEFVFGFTHPTGVLRGQDAARAALPEDRLPSSQRLLEPSLEQATDVGVATGEAAASPALEGSPPPDAGEAPAPGAVTPVAGAAAATTGAAVASAAAPAPAAVDDPTITEEEYLAHRIAALEDEVDEKALLVDRDALMAVEMEYRKLQNSRLTRGGDGSVRLSVADVERISEVAGLIGGHTEPRGRAKLGILHGDTLELQGQGTLGVLGEVLGALDLAGALVGTLEIQAGEDENLWTLRCDVHLLDQ